MLMSPMVANGVRTKLMILAGRSMDQRRHRSSAIRQKRNDRYEQTGRSRKNQHRAHGAIQSSGEVGFQVLRGSGAALEHFPFKAPTAA
jgi:hypothetical protein